MSATGGDEAPHLSIGEVLSLVQADFPDVTISKIRFLESQGLLDPERTPSGYRKFYERDIERLQWILTQQRDNFLPLKVIRERLAEWDATGARPADGPAGSGESEVSDHESDDLGLDVRHAAAALAAATVDEVIGAVAPEAPIVEPAPDSEPEAGAAVAAAVSEPLRVGPGDSALTAEELAARVGVPVSVVHDLEGFGMIGSRRVGPETYYDPEHLEVVEAARAFIDHGIEVRHLRMYKIAAEREAGVFEQLVMPLLKQRNPDARARAVATVESLAEVGEALHGALLRRALRSTLP